jgi:hypothetical protein
MYQNFYDYYKALIKELEELKIRLDEVSYYSGVNYEYRPKNHENHSRVESTAENRIALYNKISELIDLKYEIDRFLISASLSLWKYISFKAEGRTQDYIRKQGIRINQALKDQEQDTRFNSSRD